jgi:hypothetical protein
MDNNTAVLLLVAIIAVWSIAITLIRRWADLRRNYEEKEL